MLILDILMVASMYTTKVGVPLDYPVKVASQQEGIEKDIVIEISKTGKYIINDTQYDDINLEKIKALIDMESSEYQGYESVSLIIKAHKETSYIDVVNLLNQVKHLGVASIDLATIHENY